MTCIRDVRARATAGIETDDLETARAVLGRMQQNLQAAVVGVVILQAPSHRLIHLRPLMPEILAALADPQPGELLSVGTRDAP